MFNNKINQLLTQGNFLGCLKLLERLPAKLYSSQHWLVKARCQNSLNDNDAAIDTLTQAIAIHPNDSSVAYYLSYIYLECEKPLRAIETLEKAICSNLGNPQLYTLSSDAYAKCNQFEKAFIQLEFAKKFGLGSAEYYFHKQDIERKKYDIAAANKTIQAGLRLHPNNFQLNYALGCVYRDVGRIEEAIEIFERIHSDTTQNLPEISFVVACCYQDIGKLEKAEQFLKKCISLAPYYVPAHENLNMLYWNSGKHNLFLNSYKEVFSKYPSHSDLEYSRLSLLFSTKKYDKALKAVQEINSKEAKLDRFVHFEAVVNEKLGNTAISNAQFKLAAEMNRKNPRYQLDYAGYYIKNGNYKAADKILENILTLYPHNQEIWAYRSLCWRLLNDDRYEWLNDYESLIRVFTLPIPNGYKTLSDFLQELSSVLRKLHSNSHNPLDQSVNGGTQTDGHLLYKKHPTLELYKSHLSLVIEEYFNYMPTDKKHPLSKRYSGKYTLAGSWSVKLEEHGFHNNHVHQMGWISGPTYLQIPDDICKNDPSKSGWIKFGETSLNLGDREKVAKVICPKAGDVVLFPSYVWHGTYPLKSKKSRITLTNDITPIG